MTKRKPEVAASSLLLTTRGQSWLQQIEGQDREAAERLVRSLTLISHNEFQRGIIGLLESGMPDGVCALYAAREMDSSTTIEGLVSDDPQEIDAIARGADVGSESTIAQLIRNFCRTSPGQHLNHPSLEKMRLSKCRHIVVVDDILGSGNRVSSYLNMLWRSRSIRSWWSRKDIRFHVLTYSSTEVGQQVVRQHRSKPALSMCTPCPAIGQLPWSARLKDQAIALCKKYGKRTSRRSMALGYKKSCSLMVFEHSCPNNVPSFLWARGTESFPWEPLFPEKTVLGAQGSVFPAELERRDPKLVLLEAGDARLAKSGALYRRGERGRDILIVLALVSKGMRSASAISYATSMDHLKVIGVLDLCIRWNLLTRTLRPTRAGMAELRYARGFGELAERLPKRLDTDYYPKQLRGPIAG